MGDIGCCTHRTVALLAKLGLSAVCRRHLQAWASQTCAQPDTSTGSWRASSVLGPGSVASWASDHLEQVRRGPTTKKIMLVRGGHARCIIRLTSDTNGQCAVIGPVNVKVPGGSKTVR
jgi:hypothetical protein